MTQQAQQLPQMSCPLCLRLIERMTAINPNRRQQSRLCQECGINERVVRCSACACELCAECDAKIHSFATTKGHQRTPIANAGNVSGMLVQLPCQSPSHKTVVAEAMLKGVQTSTLAHPLYTETTQQAAAAEYYCMEDKLMVCAFCHDSDFYRNKKCISLQEAVELRVRELREETDKCRQLAGELHQLMFKYQECDRLDENLHQIALAELRTTRDVVISSLQSKFDQLEVQLQDTLIKRHT